MSLAVVFFVAWLVMVAASCWLADRDDRRKFEERSVLPPTDDRTTHAGAASPPPRVSAPGSRKRDVGCRRRPSTIRAL